MFKSKRQRLLAVVVLILVAAAAGAAFWVVRQQQNDRNIAAMGPRGVADYEAGDYPEAMTKLAIYLRRYPDDAHVLYTFAQARLKVEDSKGRHISQARDTLRRVIALDGKRLDARRDLMNLYVRMGYLTEAVDAADGVLKLDPGDRDAMFTKALALMQLRRADRLREALVTLGVDQVMAQLAAGQDVVLPPEPRELREHLLALQILQTLDAVGEPCPIAPTWNEGILKYARAITAGYPENPGMLLVEAAAQRVVGDSARAEELLLQAAAMPLTDPQLSGQLAAQFDSLRKFTEATNVLARGVAETGDPALRKALARRLWQSGRLKELTELLMPVEPAAPDADAEMIVLRILSAHTLGEVDHARQLAGELAKRDKDPVAQAWSPLLSEVILTGEDIAPAKLLELTTAALQRLPGDPHILMLDGSAHNRLRDHQRAIDSWTQAARAAAPWHLPYLRLSRLYSADGRGEEAWAMAGQADLRAPGRTEVAVAYALAAAAIGEPRIDLAKLLELVEKIQKAAPNEPDTLPLYLTLLARADRTEDARAVLQQLLAITDKTPAESLLLRVADVSHRSQLGAADELLDRSAQAHGVSPAWAVFQARLKLAAGDAPAALAAFEAARQDARATGAKAQWGLAWAELLTQAPDDRAAAEWKTLAAAYPEDLAIQRAALSARPMQNDREFLSAAIDRVRRLAGEESIDWRMARARWLLSGDAQKETAAEAALLLQEVLRLASDEVEARRLLALALQRTGSLAGAIEQLELAVNQRLDRADIALELAALLQSRSDFERARQQIDRILDNRAATELQRRQAATLLERQGDTAAAIAVLEADTPQGETAAGEPDLLLARLYWRRNDTAAARDIFEKLLASDAKNPVILQFAADFFASQGDRARADQILEQLGGVELQPGVLHLVLADHHSRFGQPDQAAIHYRAATDALPDNVFAWRQSAAFLYGLGRLKEANQCVADALKKVPGDPVLQRMSREQELLAKTEPLTALRPLIAAALIQPEHQDAALATARLIVDSEQKSRDIQAREKDLELRQQKQQQLQNEWSSKLRLLADQNSRFQALQTMAATSFIMIGQTDEAIRIATRAMQSFPTAAEPAVIAATAFGTARRFGEMLATAREWRKRTASQPLPADLTIASAALALNQPVVAIDHLQPYVSHALTAEAQGAQVIESYVRGLIAAGRVDEAERLLSPRLAQSPMVRGVWWRMTMALPRQEIAAAWLSKLDAALPEAAFDEHLRSAEGWRNLGRRFRHQPYIDAGEQIIIKLTERADATAAVYFARGTVAEQHEDLIAAEAAYRRALAIDPGHALAKNNLAMILAGRAEGLQEALLLAEQSAAALSTEAGIYDTLATVRAARGEYREALAAVERAVALEPESLLWRIDLAWALLKVGERTAAEAVYVEINDKLNANLDLRRALPALIADRLNEVETALRPLSRS